MDTTEQHRCPGWTLGDRLRKARRRAGLTVAEFAGALQVTASALGQYETDRAHPRDVVQLARRVEAITGTPAEWTLGLIESPPATVELPVIRAS